MPRFHGIPTRKERAQLVTAHAQPGVQLVLASPKAMQHRRGATAGDSWTVMLCFHWSSRKWVCPECQKDFDSPVAAAGHDRKRCTLPGVFYELQRISGCNGDLVPFRMPAHRELEAWKTRALEHIRDGEATAAMNEAPTLAKAEQRRSLERKLAILCKYNKF